MAETEHPNPRGLSMDQQTRGQREAQFVANLEAHFAASIGRHTSILERIEHTLDLLRPRDVPVEVRTILLTASADAQYSSLAIVLPDGIPWILASVLFLAEPGAAGSHTVTIANLTDDTIAATFDAGDPQARWDLHLPLQRSTILRLRDTGSGSGNILVALRCEPARW